MSIENPTPSSVTEIFTPITEKGPRPLSLDEIKTKITALIPKKNQDPVLTLEEDGMVVDKDRNLPTKERLETLRTLEDKDGIYLHEVVFIDETGDTTLYSYRRAGDYAELRAANTVIDAAYYMGAMKDDICIGGDTLSNYDESTGQWTDVK